MINDKPNPSFKENPKIVSCSNPSGISWSERLFLKPMDNISKERLIHGNWEIDE